jgi:hypothetical protein
MNNDNHFEVIEIETTERGNSLDIIFSNEERQRREVSLKRSRIPQFLAALQGKIEDSSVTPINRASFQEGQDFALEGFQAQLHSSGAAQLLFFVRLPDQNNRGVTVPLHLTPDDRLALGKMLGFS